MKCTIYIKYFNHVFSLTNLHYSKLNIPSTIELPRITKRQQQFKQKPHSNSKQMKRNEIVRRLREKPSRHLVFDMPETTNNQQPNNQTTEQPKSTKVRNVRLWSAERARKETLNWLAQTPPLKHPAIIGLTSGATNPYHFFILIE